MRKFIFIATLFLSLYFITFHVNGQGVIIYTAETGFCSVVGSIDTNVEGYESEEGYANVNNEIGASILWSVEASEAGTYQMQLRYAFGGNNNPRHGEVWINESYVADTIEFEYTGAWTTWNYTDTIDIDLEAGANRIRVVALFETGLPNTDFLELHGDGLEGAFCLPSYSLIVNQNLEAGGSISYNPIKNYYDEGELITVISEPNEGFFFHSWSGSAPSTDAEHTFPISSNSIVTAMFYPDGTTMGPDIVGYATVQDDEGTPFLLIGGALGDTVLATTRAELETYLDSDGPLIVTVDRKIEGSGQIKIRSDKTLLGINEDAHLEGIMLQIAEAQNVIIQNMTFSFVVRYDLIEITHNSRNVWIDNCEFFNDRDHHQDYYDGLLDIKNAARHLTVSRSKFHDHFKSILISSGDGSVGDTAIRITLHHNYFYNLGSRIPSLRFGKAHIFNNYYRNSSDGINSRMGACIRIEKNYFENMGKAIHIDYSPEGGFLQLIDNVFESSGYISEPTCELDVPYEYEHILNDPEDLPALLGSGTTSLPSIRVVNKNKASVYPNPAGSTAIVSVILEKVSDLKVEVYNISGQKISEIYSPQSPEGRNEILINTEKYIPGLYLLKVHSNQGIQSIKMTIN